MDSADELLDCRASDSLQAAGLPESWRSRVVAIVRLAAFLHDLGKCSEHFQAMLRRERHAPQLVRHEALTLWLCWPGMPLAAWLGPAVASETDYLLALVAASGHHRKFWTRAVAEDDAGAGTRLSLLTSHQDFQDLLHQGAHSLDGIGSPPTVSDVVVEATRLNNPRHRLQQWEGEWNHAVPPGSPEARLVAVCKALVVAADVSGSALPRAGERSGWIREALGRRADPERLRRLVERRLEGKPLRDFQGQVAASTAPVTLVSAGCGTGKTAAAYLWAAQNHPGRQLWVSYPTTGTATEGFRDYVFGADIEGRLEHSRAAVDLEILGLADDSEGPRDRDRLEALRAWAAEAITCTVDSVLGLVQNQRRGLYAWPSFARAAFVFDEIHSYDEQLFGSLLRFLQTLPGAPCLLMTASLPQGHVQALRDLVRRVHECDLAEIAGPLDLEVLPRYRIAGGDPTDLVRDCLGNSGKALWVCNTVDRCLGVAVRGVDPPLRYHSRFRYVDRVSRHADVVAAFRQPGPAFAATTQVAEMSLDLSADLLVTDLAPIPALIQRLGRLNRRSTPEAPVPAKPFAVVPFQGQPYGTGELAAAKEWLAALSTSELSQRDLIERWTARETAPLEVASAWLDGGFSTLPAAVRDPSPGITVVLAEDAASVRRGEVDPVEVALPMNPPPSHLPPWTQWPQARCFPVPPADAVSYDPLRGGRWLRG